MKLAVTANGARSGGIAFGWGSRLDSLRRPVRHDVAFRLEANHWNGTVAPQLVVRRIFETPQRYEELRNRFAAEWRAGPEAWSPEARQVFAELGLDEDPTARRSLAESPTFRALLDEPLAAAAVIAQVSAGVCRRTSELH